MEIPKLLILDMDGLMFDTEAIGKRFYFQAAREEGYEVSNELYDSLLGGNKTRNRQILMNHFGDDYPYTKIGERTAQLCSEFYKQHGIGVKKGLIELLEYAKQKHIFVAVASSSMHSVVEKNLRLANVNHYIDYVISGDQVEHSKPHPEIFLKACTYFHVMPQDALVLEDSKNGILAARAANIPVICVPDLVFHTRDVFNLTYATVASLDKVIDLIEYRPKVAIFDMDGLMFDTERLSIKPLIKAHKDNGYTLPEEIAYQLIGTSGVYAKNILMDYFGEDYPFDKIGQDFGELFFKTIRNDGLPIKDGLIKLLNQLHDLNIKCVIASSSNTEVIEEYLDISHTSHYFEYIVGGDEVELTKPHPDIFIKACEIAGVNANEAVVFEDSKNGILAASEAQIPVICIPDILLHNQMILQKTMAFMPSLSRVHFNS